jgi:hypothetical protein
MALDKHGLSELLDALRAGGDLHLVRSGMQGEGGLSSPGLTRLV